MENIIDTICAKADEASIRQAGQILKRGGLVAFPTETVYGLGADALNEDAAAKIYAAKGRPSDNPLIVHITERKMLDGIVSEVSPQAELLMEKFWPGPMTLIFKKSDLVPYGTTGGLDTVAVRMPSHPIARAVIDAGGGYIAAPSANTSGRPSPTKASHVEEDLCGKIDMILDGGEVAEKGLVSEVFAAPKSAAGRRLVFPGGADALVSDPQAVRRVRLTFRDSVTTGTPLVARLASEEGILCTVISASTQKLSEEVYGSMLLGIPSGQFQRAMDYISAMSNIRVEEVDGHVQ